MVPFTRMVGAGCADAIAHDAASSAPARVIFIVVMMSSLKTKARRRKPAAR
jgi:hypothetical protein